MNCTTMKRLLALVLAMTMILSLTACLGDGSSPTEPSSDPTTAPTTAPTEAPEDTPDPPTDPTEDPKSEPDSPAGPSYSPEDEPTVPSDPTKDPEDKPSIPDEPEVPDEPETPDEPESITLKVWVPYEHTSWLKDMLTKFEEAHPDYVINWELGVCAEGDASNKITANVSAAADVFMYPNDQMNTLISVGTLAPLDSNYKSWLEGNTSTTMIKTVTYTDGQVYGFPYSSNTWFMYYNKDVYTEEDVKSLDTMLEKGKVSFPLSDPWYIWSFYAAGGATLFGEDGHDAAAGIKLGSKGVDITRYLVNLRNHANFVHDNKEYKVLDGMRNGTVDAIFSGSWDAPRIKELLGDRMGVAQLPTITVNGEQLQLQSFYGSKAVGVNQQSKHADVAMELAAFLTSPEAQLARYDAQGVIPCATALENHAAILADPVVYAQMQTINNTSRMQPIISEMQRFWTPTANMGADFVKGFISLDFVSGKTEMFEQSLNKLGL